MYMYMYLNVCQDDLWEIALGKGVDVLGATLSCCLNWYVLILVEVDTSQSGTK